MSTDLKTAIKTVSATRFAMASSTGMGQGIQLTKQKAFRAATTADSMFDSIQLSRGEALAMAHTLLAFALGQEEEA